MKNYYHTESTDGWRCKETGKEVSWVWSNHKRPGIHNGCQFCDTPSAPGIGAMLQALKKKRLAARCE